MDITLKTTDDQCKRNLEQFMFQRFLFLALVVVLLAAFPTQADSTWSAWVYDSPSGQLWRVTDTATPPTALALPVEADAVLSADLLVAPDGSLIAYTVTYAGARSVQFFDTAQAWITATYTPSVMVTRDSFDSAGSAEQFSEDGTRFAYAYQSAAGAWRIDVIDTQTGGLVASLDSVNSGLAAADVPLIFDLNGSRVLFNLLNANGAWIGYAWDVNASAVMPTGMNLHADYDVFRSTGDLIMPGDLTTAAVSAAPTNALLVYQPLSGQVYPFYTERDARLHAPRFIQNGERIVVCVDLADGRETLHVIERDGETVGELPASIPSRSIFGTPDGLIYMRDGELWFAETRGALNAGRPLFRLPASARIADVATSADQYGPYERWANLSPNMPVLPTAAPPPATNPAALGDVTLDMGALADLGVRAAAPPLAPTPRAVVTLPPPGG